MPGQAANRMTAEQYRQMQGKADSKRRHRGKRSRESGAAFEDLITASCEWYKNSGLAEIDKTPEPMRVLEGKTKGRFTACFLKKAQPDYKGTIQGGRSVVFEAKHTDTGKMEQSRVTQEQAKALEQHNKLGAECFVLLSFGMRDFYRVPWPDWRDMKAVFGHKHVTPEELERYRLELGGNGVLKLLGDDTTEKYKEGTQ